MLKEIWDARVNHSYSAPALRFEEVTGIAGVGRIYKMPGGVSMQYMESLLPHYDFSAFLMKKVIPADEKLRFAWGMSNEDIAPFASTAQDKMSLLIDRLCDLNPELKNVRFDRADFRACWHFTRGVTSGFNPEDIQFYLDDDKDDRAQANAYLTTGAYGRLNKRCEDIFGKDSNILRWDVSPETAARIDRELDRRYGPDPLIALPKQERRRILEQLAEESFGPELTRSQLFRRKIQAALSMPRVLS